MHPEATDNEKQSHPTGQHVLRIGRVLPPVLALLGVLLHPTQITVRQWADLAVSRAGAGEGLVNAIPAVNVTLSDLCFLAGFLVWFPLRWYQGKLLKWVRSYPVPLVALFLVGVLSMVPFLKSAPAWATPPVMEASRGAKQLVQFFLFFVCAFVLLADYLSDPRWRTRILIGFVVAATIVGLTGLSEYLQLRPPSPENQRAGAITSALHIDASFGFEGEAAGAHERIGTRSNRNVLGAWLTLALPLLWAGFLFIRNSGWKLTMLALTALGALLLLHGGLWLLAMIALLTLAYLHGRIAFGATAAGLFVFFGLLFWQAPQQPDQVMLDSLMLRRTTDRFRTLPVYSINPELDRSGQPADLRKAPYSPWEQKYIQWQPSLLALARNPLFGVGLGNYQRNINAFYADKDFGAYGMPKASMDLMEKGGNALYAVWVAETGLVGMFAVIWLFLAFIRRGVKSARQAWRRDDHLAAMFKTGASVAIGAAALGGFFTNYWVRGLGYALVFALALAWTYPFETREPGTRTGAGTDEP